MAGNPKVYGQLVQILAPYTRVIKDGPKDEAEGAQPPPDAAPADATQAFVQTAAEPERKPPLRIRKAVAAEPDDAPV